MLLYLWLLYLCLYCLWYVYSYSDGLYLNAGHFKIGVLADPREGVAWNSPELERAAAEDAEIVAAESEAATKPVDSELLNTGSTVIYDHDQRLDREPSWPKKFTCPEGLPIRPTASYGPSRPQQPPAIGH